VHRLWRPIRGELDDYIFNPKASGYQSLHSAVIGLPYLFIAPTLSGKAFHCPGITVGLHLSPHPQPISCRPCRALAKNSIPLKSIQPARLGLCIGLDKGGVGSVKNERSLWQMHSVHDAVIWLMERKCSRQHLTVQDMSVISKIDLDVLQGQLACPWRSKLGRPPCTRLQSTERRRTGPTRTAPTPQLLPEPALQATSRSRLRLSAYLGFCVNHGGYHVPF
jgi:hypothetical protein